MIRRQTSSHALRLEQARDRYLGSRGVKGPWVPAGSPESGFAGAVVIPALAESPHLFETLRSLAANPPELLERFLVIVVVNHREDAPPGDKADNLLTLERLAADSPSLAPLRLAWVDGASPGMELPAKGGGVGLARKIGFDLALRRLDSCSGPILVALDADTLVEPSYLPALVRHFGSATAGGAVIPFCHQPGDTPAEQEAIDRYELFLRSYVLGLALAGSPYAFHTVGSAMACTVDAYLRMGGMNSRVAGEDFYFLQQLQRTAGVLPVAGTTVHPSARRSHRVPFGTGRSITRQLDGDSGAVSFYRHSCFLILREWLRLATTATELSGEQLLCHARELSPYLHEYLDNAGLPGVWERLKRNAAGDAAMMTAFHGWFDALRTMKLVHHLSAEAYPRCDSDAAVIPLLAAAGLERIADAAGQLELLRRLQ